MKKETKIFVLIIVISVAVLTALDIQTKGKITSLLGSVNPMNLKSSDVPYTNNSQSTVQGAIDNLYSKTSSINTYKNLVCPGCVYRKSTTTKYNVNSSSSNNTLSSSEYTTDYTKLNINYFLGHVIDESGNILSSYACGINNGIFFCLRGVDSSQSSLTYNPFYKENFNKAKQAFSECSSDPMFGSSCTSDTNATFMDTTGQISVGPGGYCYCQVTSSGSSNCSEPPSGMTNCK